jgi:hypothetical protein
LCTSIHGLNAAASRVASLHALLFSGTAFPSRRVELHLAVRSGSKLAEPGKRCALALGRSRVTRPMRMDGKWVKNMKSTFCRAEEKCRSPEMALYETFLMAV